MICVFSQFISSLFSRDDWLHRASTVDWLVSTSTDISVSSSDTSMHFSSKMLTPVSWSHPMRSSAGLANKCSASGGFGSPGWHGFTAQRPAA